jgi:hypothetical protein
MLIKHELLDLIQHFVSEDALYEGIEQFLLFFSN